MSTGVKVCDVLDGLNKDNWARNSFHTVGPNNEDRYCVIGWLFHCAGIEADGPFSQEHTSREFWAALAEPYEDIEATGDGFGVVIAGIRSGTVIRVNDWDGLDAVKNLLCKGEETWI